MSPRICLVTGSNKGIGLEAVRQISKFYSEDDVVYLTSRDKQRGAEAMKILQEEGLQNIRYLQLDLEDIATINSAAQTISKEHGKLDVLVNNAGIDSTVDEQASVREDLQEKLISPDLKVEELSTLIKDYVEKTKTNSHLEAGYSKTSYGMSKLAVIALSKVHARELADDNIAVVSMCPGWCKTDMTGANAPKSAADGADIVTYLATRDNIMELSGKFIREKEVAVW